MRWLLTIILCLGPAVLWAREPDATLGVLITPNEGRPAVTVPGGSFAAHLTEDRDVALEGPAGRFPLTTEQPRPLNGILEVFCHVPDTCAPGTYAMVAENGDRDITERSVFVLEHPLEAYDVAHVAEPRAGSHESRLILANTAAKINERDAALVLLTGNLTEAGRLDDYRALLEFLWSLNAPAIVSAGPEDDPEGRFAQVFGPAAYAVRVAPDAYLSVPPTDGVDVRLGSVPAQLYRLRRETRDARWSVGLAHRYAIDADMRSQIVLLVDDPLDFLVLTDGPDEDPGEVPWGTAAYLTSPRAAGGSWRMMRVQAVEPLPGDVLEIGPNVIKAE